MRQNVSETLEVSRLELLYRASIHSDLQVWIAFQQSLEETVLTWFHEHPGKETACRLQSERHYVALAFERFRQAAVQGQVTCETHSEVLMYLRASLNGAILHTLRVSNRREQRLVYLLYHCGLEPAEIVWCCPQEWRDVHEVTRLRRSILERFLKELI